MPAITGTRPSTAAAMAATTSRRSCADRLPASPIVPVPTMPCTPASRRAVTLACSAVMSTPPWASKGVVTAGMMPGKCTEVSSVKGHIAPDALDVLSGVERGRVGVAVDDGFVDHAVLGRVELRAARDGHGLVA